MASTALIVVEHESGTPVMGLYVSWYITEARELPKTFRDPTNWEKLRSGGWADISPTLLGGATTDRDGRATLDFANVQDILDEKAAKRGRKLWYTVQQAEIVGSAKCGELVYAACELKPLALIDDERLLRIPERELRRLREATLENQQIAPQFSIDDVALSLAEFGSLSSDKQRQKTRKTSIAAKQNRRVRDRLRKLPASRARPSVVIPVSINISGAGGASLELDDTVLRAGERTLDAEARQLVKPLVNARLDSANIKQPTIHLDFEGNAITLEMPSATGRLEID